MFSGLRARHRRSLPQWFRLFGTLVPVSPTEASLAALGSGCVPRGHRLHLHLPGPLRSTRITRLPRYYGSSDSCQASWEAVLTPAGLSVSCAWPSDHSVSNHPTCPMIAFTHYPSASWASGSPRSGLRHSGAGSPRSKAESSSLALRTGRSPSVALHPASRRRSYCQLQAGECVPEENFHLSDRAHLQTHSWTLCVLWGQRGRRGASKPVRSHAERGNEGSICIDQ